MISAVIGVRVLVGVATVPVVAAPAVPTRRAPSTTPTTSTATTASTTDHDQHHHHHVAGAAHVDHHDSVIAAIAERPGGVMESLRRAVAGRLTGRADRAAAVAVSVDGRLVHAAGFGRAHPTIRSTS